VRAEEEFEAACELNFKGSYNLAVAARESACTIIQISTDYVFNGMQTSAYGEESERSPINNYGASKELGEKALLENLPEAAYVVRTSWLYGVRGKNFVKTIAKRAINGEFAAVVADQFGSPTSARDLASGICQIIETAPESGVYHYSNTGKCSWFDLAQEIYRLAGRDLNLVTPIKSEVLTQKAKRPMNSHLSIAKWESSNLSKIRPWKVSLEELLPEILAAVNEETLS
jgi:dTDP-4-dehydrorhamnose reductase